MVAIEHTQLRSLGPQHAVLTDSVCLLHRGLRADLYGGRSPLGERLFFFEDARYRWLVGESPDVTLEGYRRWGMPREELLARVVAPLAGPGEAQWVRRLQHMLPVSATESDPTFHAGTTSRAIG